METNKIIGNKITIAIIEKNMSNTLFSNLFKPSICNLLILTNGISFKTMILLFEIGIISSVNFKYTSTSDAKIDKSRKIFDVHLN